MESDLKEKQMCRFAEPGKGLNQRDLSRVSRS
jgi:hypothetical protein